MKIRIKIKKLFFAIFIFTSLILFNQNCSNVNIEPLNLTSNKEPEVFNVKTIKGEFCNQGPVSADSTMRLSQFYIFNLTSHKLNGKIYPDSNLDGMVETGDTPVTGQTVFVSSLDSDGDGLPDFVEKLKGLNPVVADADSDGIDLDGITNRRELQLGTDPAFFGDERSIQYEIETVDAAVAGCGAGQPAYKFNVSDIKLSRTEAFTDTVNSPVYSLSHAQNENILMVVAYMTPDDIRKPSIFLTKFFKLNALQVEDVNLRPQDFFVLGVVDDDCTECGSVGTGARYKKLFSGIKHTCALNESNRALCWGENGSGQLGDGTTSVRLSPVVPALDEPILSMGLGTSHSCAVTLNNEVYCWGANNYGQLGNNSIIDSSRPVKVALAATDRAVDVVAGDFHTCAILMSGIKCWGRNNFYQLGDRTTTNSSVPVSAILPPGVNVASLLSASAKLNHNCIVTANGAALCWGQVAGCTQKNVNYVPNTCEQASTAPPLTFPMEGIRLTQSWKGMATSGYANSGIARDYPNKVTCWSATIIGGVARNGARPFDLGCGMQEDNGEPELLPPNFWDYEPSTEFTFMPEKVEKITMGLNHSCAINLERNVSLGLDVNVLNCWGENNFGQLAQQIESPTLESLPQKVSEIVEPRDVSSGANFSCAINKNAEIFCWGLNTNGQLGTGDVINSSTPKKVKNQ